MTNIPTTIEDKGIEDLQKKIDSLTAENNNLKTEYQKLQALLAEVFITSNDISQSLTLVSAKVIQNANKIRLTMQQQQPMQPQSQLAGAPK